MTNHIPIKARYSFRKNWYLIYSYMLCPEDEDIQNDIFLYKYYNWAHLMALKGYPEIDDYEPTKVASFLFSALKNDSYNVYNQISTRLHAVEAAGKLLRILMAITKSRSDMSLSIENAIQIYQDTLKDAKIKDEYFSRQYLFDFYKSKKDVWHLCAAFTTINPVKKSNDRFSNRVIKFLSLAKYYRAFGTKTKKLRRKVELNETLIDNDTVFNIPPVYKLHEVADADLGIDDYSSIVLGRPSMVPAIDNGTCTTPSNSSDCSIQNEQDEQSSDSAIDPSPV